MKLSGSVALGAAALMVLAGFGCKKFSKDKSPVVASVAGEKITENQFRDIAKALVQDEKKVNDLLQTAPQREQRNQVLESIATQKAMIRFGKLEGLEKDPQTKVMMEQAQARAYFQILVERRLQKGDPTDAQIKPMYDELVAQRKAAGQDKGLPPFEDPQVKKYLAGAWKQKQEQTVSEALLKDVKQKFPVTFSDGYKPNPQPMMMPQQQ